MEGFKSLVFNGDKIIWQNFFKHYLMCLERIVSLYVIAGEEHHTITSDNIPVYDGFDDFPTHMYKKMFENIWEEFFSICGDLINKISTRTTTVKIDELTVYFCNVHILAVQVIEKHFVGNNLIPPKTSPIQIDSKAVGALIKMIDIIENHTEGIASNSLDNIFLAGKNFSDDLILARNNSDKTAYIAPNRHFILVNFVNNYLNSLEKLLYSEWYTACFMSESTNSSVWGHYGDNHKGVCLIFESDEDNNIELNSTSKQFSKIKLNFQPIKYTDDYPEIDFFRTLGRLPENKIIRTWHSDESGKVSNSIKKIFGNKDKWRDLYWKMFHENILTKNNDWSYENEHRLILSSAIDGFKEREHRVFKYNLMNLKGVIFGIKTSEQDKLRIIEIIQRKCLGCSKNDFDFQQAYYCHHNKNIQSRKLHLIKL